MAGKASNTPTRQLCARKGNRSFSPVINNDAAMAISVKCAVRVEYATRSICSKSKTQGPQTIPAARYKPNVVTGPREIHPDASDIINSSPPTAAVQPKNPMSIPY
ncbi:hypothetical protein SRABI106_00652 [Rahnella aquatilis]|nr:hypothetical protein SRABI106_00652 [Rahnella aquatilis]